MTKPKSNRFPYSRFDKFCIRTPILPLKFYYKLTSGNRITDEFLKLQWENILIREAIYLASPDFYHQLKDIICNQHQDRFQWEKIRQTFIKYLIRMSTRSTPFGLFAGCSIGEFGKTNCIRLANVTEGKRVTHLDMHFLVRFAYELNRKNEIKSKLIYNPNSSLYKVGDWYRYVEYSYEENHRIHSLESIRRSKLLDTLIQASKSGISFKDLVARLRGMRVSEKEAKIFVDEMIEHQLLISNLEVRVSGQDYLNEIIVELKRIKAPSNVIKLCTCFKNHLARIDKKIGQPKDIYERFIDFMTTNNIKHDTRYLFQTDYFPKLTASNLSHSITRKIKNGIMVLNRVSEENINENLDKFKERFSMKFETRRIPLLLALDVETGVGYGPSSNFDNSTTILDDLIVNEGTRSEDIIKFSVSPFIEKLLPKIHSVNRSGDLSIILEDRDVNHQDLVWESSPSTLAVMVEVFELNGDSKISLNYCGGNAAKLLARFSDGDVEIASLIKDIIDKESETNKDVILAEIIHLPKERTGNILRRPSYRKNEIPYLAAPSVPKENQIPLQDLDLQLVNNTVRLYSRSRNARVIPKLTNAHNFGLGDTPVYHFLCDLQYQDNKAFGFSWGPVRILLDFLPRLEYRNLIISKAQWKITKEELSGVLGKEFHIDLKKISKWRKKRNIPKQVQVLEGDNKLCLNFTNYDSLYILISVIENNSNIWVEEFLLTADNCLVTGEHGKYSSEIIVPFYLNKNLELK